MQNQTHENVIFLIIKVQEVRGTLDFTTGSLADSGQEFNPFLSFFLTFWMVKIKS